MEILIADFLFVEAHKDMNTNFIIAASQHVKCDVISLNGFYDTQKELFCRNNINLINLKVKKKTGLLGARLFSLDLMKKTAQFVANKKYHAILCLGFETTLFWAGLKKFGKVPLFILHHKNIDELTNVAKRIAFAMYKKKVYHMVFEVFFRNRLVSGINIPKNRVFVVSHPARYIKCLETSKHYDCIGLCNSNDESFIREAIRKENEFEKKGLSVIFRSKNIEKKCGAVEIINGFLKKEVYDEYFSAGKAVFVPFPKAYVYRLSGSIYDAFSREKMVYTTSRFYAQEYEKTYPGICHYVESIDQLIELLVKGRSNKNAESFQKFIDDHSIAKVSNEIASMLNQVIYDN